MFISQRWVARLNSTSLQRVCNAEYYLPSDVEIAPEFEDLLRGMLEPDNTKRMSVKAILQHPWFSEGLPPGVVEMNARLPDGPSPDHGQVQILRLPDPKLLPEFLQSSMHRNSLQARLHIVLMHVQVGQRAYFCHHEQSCIDCISLL